MISYSNGPYVNENPLKTVTPSTLGMGVFSKYYFFRGRLVDVELTPMYTGLINQKLDYSVTYDYKALEVKDWHDALNISNYIKSLSIAN